MACSSFSSSPPGEDAGAGGGDADTVSRDTGVDIVPDSAVVGPFCKAHSSSVICDDFDDPARKLWSPPEVSDGGSLAVVPADDAPSKPSVLRLTAVPAPDKLCDTAHVLESASLGNAAPNGFHLEFKVRADTLPASGVATGPSVVLEVAADKCDYYLELTPTKVSLVQEHNDGAATTRTSVGQARMAGAWSSVSIDVEGAVGARTVTVQVDGTKGIDKQPVDGLCQKAGQIIAAGIGLFCVNADTTGSVDISYDDVLVTVR